MMRQIAGALRSGVALTIDYGEYARELYSPIRSGGTLRTFQSHLLGNRPLVGIGSQDITASVDFTALQEEGEQAGLRSLGMTTQADALSSLGIRDVVRQPSWTALHPSARARKPHGSGRVGAASRTWRLQVVPSVEGPGCQLLWATLGGPARVRRLLNCSALAFECQRSSPAERRRTRRGHV